MRLWSFSVAVQLESYVVWFCSEVGLAETGDPLMVTLVHLSISLLLLSLYLPLSLCLSVSLSQHMFLSAHLLTLMGGGKF